MSPGGNPRPFGLAVAGLAVSLGLVLSGFAPPVLFDLIGHDRERWIERFGTGQEEAVIQVEGGEGTLPYVLPGPADEWA